MYATEALLTTQVNWARYQPGQSAGHYESFFVRANHPERPLAFWIRYTIFSPDNQPQAALAELWAISFDGEVGRHVAAKIEVPFAQCAFSNTEFLVRVGDRARLEPGKLTGAAASGGHTVAWDLSFRGGAEPLLFLPPRLYETKLPRAKSVVSVPLAVFSGQLEVDGRTIPIVDWLGSQNHNWGARHTDHYAWGQVAGFDGHPDSFLEVATARLKLGPLWTPPMTLIVPRHRGQEFAFNRLGQALRAEGSFSYFTWHFSSETDTARIEGTITAPRQTFVGLRYANPPGGIKHCLNSKLGDCELRLTDRRAGQAGPAERLHATHRAAFEIVTDDRDHGVPILA
jgi:hypothetical protein